MCSVCEFTVYRADTESPHSQSHCSSITSLQTEESFHKDDLIFLQHCDSYRAGRDISEYLSRVHKNRVGADCSRYVQHKKLITVSPRLVLTQSSVGHRLVTIYREKKVGAQQQNNQLHESNSFYTTQRSQASLHPGQGPDSPDSEWLLNRSGLCNTACVCSQWS